MVSGVGGSACFGGVRVVSGGRQTFSAAGPVSTFSISQGQARPATWSQGTGTARWTELQDWSTRCPCLALCLLSTVQQTPRCGGDREDRGGWGGSAYRGGAGGENVITRSSLLKVRHRLVGTEFMGGGGHSEPGLGWGQEATPECPTEQHQEPLAPGRGGHRQTQH